MKKRKRKFDILGFRKAWRDIANYRDWIQTIKQEEENKDSLFNRFNMGRNQFYNIYVIVSLPSEGDVLNEQLQRIRVTESLAPIHRYIDEQLGFAGSITPEFNRIYQDGEPTLNYLVNYIFTFDKLSVKWGISRALILSALTYGGFQVPWTELITWISNLI